MTERLHGPLPAEAFGTCTVCGTTFTTYRRRATYGQGHHYPAGILSQGLCDRHVYRARTHGDPHAPDARGIRGREVVEEWLELPRDPHLSRRQQVKALAPRMGMTWQALEKALDRAGIKSHLPRHGGSQRRAA